MKLKELNFPLLLLCLCSLKNFIFTSSIGDACALGALAALYGYSLYLKSVKTIDVNEEVKKDLENLRSAINGLKVAKALQR